MEDWRIDYTKDGRYFLQGWVDGKYVRSEQIRQVEMDKTIVDYTGHRFNLGKPEQGAWEDSLKLKFPQGWQWFRNTGILMG